MEGKPKESSTKLVSNPLIPNLTRLHGGGPTEPLKAEKNLQGEDIRNGKKKQTQNPRRKILRGKKNCAQGALSNQHCKVTRVRRRTIWGGGGDVLSGKRKGVGSREGGKMSSLAVGEEEEGPATNAISMFVLMY